MFDFNYIGLILYLSVLIISVIIIDLVVLYFFNKKNIKDILNNK